MRLGRVPDVDCWLASWSTAHVLSQQPKLEALQKTKNLQVNCARVPLLLEIITAYWAGTQVPFAAGLPVAEVAIGKTYPASPSLLPVLDAIRLPLSFAQTSKLHQTQTPLSIFLATSNCVSLRKSAVVTVQPVGKCGPLL